LAWLSDIHFAEDKGRAIRSAFVHFLQTNFLPECCSYIFVSPFDISKENQQEN
jgi:hypothetical protein